MLQYNLIKIYTQSIVALNAAHPLMMHHIQKNWELFSFQLLLLRSPTMTSFNSKRLNVYVTNIICGFTLWPLTTQAQTAIMASCCISFCEIHQIESNDSNRFCH